MTHGTSPWRSNIVVGDIITIRPTPRTDIKDIYRKTTHHPTVGACHNRHNKVNEGFIAIASYPLPSYLLIPSRHAPRTLFPIENLSLQTKFLLYRDHHTLSSYLVTVSKLILEPDIVKPECICRTN
jgi:hypothetical protein